MPGKNYVELRIANRQVDIDDQFSVKINYSLEDRENFQTKTSAKALNVSLPATVNNDQIANTFHNPGIEDLTPGQVYKNSREGIIIGNGIEILNGKAFLKSASHQDKPGRYSFDFYGDNGDWIIDLKESTIWDFYKWINFIFTKQVVTDSWSFDGTDPLKPYVFAPVRYADPMDTLNDIQDYNMKPEYMRPALSKYWLIFYAFKSLGYRVKSDFMDTPFFRRQVMPWTWGNFLLSPGTRLDNLDFLAKSATEFKHNGNYNNWIDMHVTNDSTNGAFDNNGVYDYDAPNSQMRWTYINAYSQYGLLSATFHISIFFNASVSAKSGMTVSLAWYKNGVKVNNGGLGDDGIHGKVLFGIYSQTTFQTKQYVDNAEDWLTIQVNPGDVITARVFAHMDDSTFGSARLTASVDAFELDYFKIPIGGRVDFSAYENLKKYKFLDFLAGVFDEFNMCVKTDTTEKIVYMEPEHPYSIVHNQVNKSGGYFNGNILDWEDKHDLMEDSTLELFSDSERELSFKYKEDDNDGTYKSQKDRMGAIPGLGKYVFPPRFKTGTKEIENRFFSVVMHYDAVQWRNLGTRSGDSPQMICLIPENISNTSADEAQNTFLPKSAYYKGIVTDWGWVFDGDVKAEFPFMFAVNYKTGGENDPVLSYCDEQIGTNILKVSAVGLVRRFYLQRLAIMENGIYYTTWFKLNNNDVANFMHREHVICRGQKWEVIEIKDYDPLSDSSTEVYLRKWSPIKNT